MRSLTKIIRRSHRAARPSLVAILLLVLTTMPIAAPQDCCCQRSGLKLHSMAAGQTADACSFAAPAESQGCCACCDRWNTAADADASTDASDCCSCRGCKDVCRCVRPTVVTADLRQKLTSSPVIIFGALESLVDFDLVAVAGVALSTFDLSKIHQTHNGRQAFLEVWLK